MSLLQNVFKHSVLTLIFYLLSALFISTVFAADANISHSPEPAPSGDPITFRIHGNGFQSFIFSISGQSLIFSVGQNGCQRVSGNTAIFPSITEGDACLPDNTDRWETDIIYDMNLVDGTYEAQLSSEGMDPVRETFTVGTAEPTPSPLSVELNPKGPLKNDTEHAVTISWQPVPTKETNYFISTGILGIENFQQSCGPDKTCSLSMTIPEGTKPNLYTITVTQDGASNITGSNSLEIISSTIEEPSPPSTPTTTPEPPRPPCPEKYITPGPDGKLAGCEQVFTGLGFAISTDPTAFIRDIFGFLLSISGGILLTLIIWSGYQMMTSQGNPEKIQEARERITSAIIGFVFLVFSLVILEIIGVDILRIPDFLSGQGTTSQQESSEPVQQQSNTTNQVTGCGESGVAPCKPYEKFQTDDGCRAGLKVVRGKCEQDYGSIVAPTNRPVLNRPDIDPSNCGEYDQLPCKNKYENNNGCVKDYIPLFQGRCQINDRT